MRTPLMASAAAAALLFTAHADAKPTKHRVRHHRPAATAPAPKPVTSTDAAAMATPEGTTTSTALATKAPGGPVAHTTATTSNMSDGTKVTDVSQTSDHGPAPTAGAKMVHGEKTTQVRCADGQVRTVMVVKGSCDRHGGVVSSAVSTVMTTPPGTTTAVKTKAAGVGATAVTSTDPNSVSSTRVTQTTVYPTPQKGK